MKKNAYIKPAMQVVILKQKYCLLQASEGETPKPQVWGSLDPNNPYDVD